MTLDKSRHCLSLSLSPWSVILCGESTRPPVSRIQTTNHSSPIGSSQDIQGPAQAAPFLLLPSTWGLAVLEYPFLPLSNSVDHHSYSSAALCSPFPFPYYSSVSPKPQLKPPLLQEDFPDCPMLSFSRTPYAQDQSHPDLTQTLLKCSQNYHLLIASC